MNFKYLLLMIQLIFSINIFSMEIDQGMNDQAKEQENICRFDIIYQPKSLMIIVIDYLVTKNDYSVETILFSEKLPNDLKEFYFYSLCKGSSFKAWRTIPYEIKASVVLNDEKKTNRKNSKIFISSNNQLVATNSMIWPLLGSFVKLFDINSGICLSDTETISPGTVSFCKNHNILQLFGCYGIFQFHCLDKLKAISIINEHCYCSVIQDQRIYCGCANGMVKVLDVNQRKQILCFKAYDCAISSIKISPNNVLIAVRDRNEEIKIFKLEKGNYIFDFDISTEGLLEFYLVDNKILILCRTKDPFQDIAGELISGNNIESKKSFKFVGTPGYAKYAIKANKDEKLLLIGKNNDINSAKFSHLSLYESETGLLIKTINFTEELFDDFDISGDNSFIIVSNYDDSAKDIKVRKISLIYNASPNNNDNMEFNSDNIIS